MQLICLNKGGQTAMNDYVLGFAFNKDFREVLLILKNKGWQKGLYNGIGGKIEDFEFPEEAMVREFKEECNIDTSTKDWKRVCQMGDYTTWACEVFSIVLEDLVGYKSLTEEIVMRCIIRNIDNENGYQINLPTNCIKNLKWLIPLCIDYYENEKAVSITY